MFNADIITFREFAMQESLTLSAIQQAVLEQLRGQRDVVLFGAQAVNAYVAEPRMTQDIDLLSSDAARIAEELKDYLAGHFHIAIRLRKVADGRGFRLYQVRKGGNRHLVDIRQIESLPESREIAGVLVLAPADLIASKVISYHRRRGKPKSGTDWRDLALLLLTFPEYRAATGNVADLLLAAGADAEILKVWSDLVAQEIELEDEDEEFF